MMPDLDGWSVLAALRQDAELADIPVLMVTILDEQRRGMALGAAGYLTKPINRERLHALVDRFRSSARRTRILVVEDDPIQRERARSWLEPQQWIVTEAANGREALASLGKREAGPDPARPHDAGDGWIPAGGGLAKGGRNGATFRSSSSPPWI